MYLLIWFLILLWAIKEVVFADVIEAFEVLLVALEVGLEDVALLFVYMHIKNHQNKKWWQASPHTELANANADVEADAEASAEEHEEEDGNTQAGPLVPSQQVAAV